jgi:hypothetical protein
MTTKISPASARAIRMPMPAGISWPMHENANSMCTKLPGVTRHVFSRSPGGLPAAATSQSPGRTASLSVRYTCACVIRSPGRGARPAASSDSHSARAARTPSPFSAE